MAIPTILSGAAGRALQTLRPLDDMVTHVDDVLKPTGAWSGKVDFPKRATIVLDETWLTGPQGRHVINSAGDDITRALGATRKSGLSSELHAATRNIQSRLEPPTGPVTATASQIRTNVAQVRTGLDELGAAARSTATKRMVIGSLATGGALAGLIALRGGIGGSDAVPTAPGPHGDHRAPGNSGTSV